MRSLAALLVLAATATAAGVPPHLQRLPGGVLHRGPAPAALAAVTEGGRAPVWLPGGERTFEVERVVEAGANTTRFGRVRGVGQGAITLGPDGGFGRITQGATIWFLEYRGSEAFAVRAGEGGLALAAYDGGALTAPGVPRPSGAPGGAWQGSALRTVDFAGLYDADFAARYPGSLAATRIEHFVALANQAFVDSNVGVTLRTVHTQLAPGAVAPSALDNIDAMYLATSGGSFAGVDLRALRTQHGADLVSFFRVQDLYAREVCGVAYFPLSSGSGVNVVMDGASGGSLCDDYTFAHEVGHNFGARHQLAADSTPALGHAFVRPGQFTTIMATFGTGKPDRDRTLGYFSNPRIACGNLPCGTAGDGDNAGAMNQNAALVAGYMMQRQPGSATRPAPLLADSDGDGVIDRIDAFPFDAARTVDRDGDGRADPDDAFPDNSTEWVDTDGGGQGDNADTDDDNDGVADGSDRFPLDPLESADADNDGYGNAGDGFDAAPREQRDTDGDGTGDRADADDDGDGTDDVGLLLSAADGEMIVADGATDRLLRFDGATFAPLGTLLQLESGAVTFRSGIAGAASGELYFVAASQLRTLDRLRSATAELMLDTASHPQVGTGFPLSPVLLDSGDVMVSEMGRGVLVALRPAPSRAAVPAIVVNFVIQGTDMHLACDAGNLLVLDVKQGDLLSLVQVDPFTSAFPRNFWELGVLPEFAGGDSAMRPGGLLYWVDRRDGAVRTLDPADASTGSLTIAGANAAAITVGPDDVLYVAQRSGGVRAYDAGTGADLGLVIGAADAAEPLGIAWVPKILDPDLPAIVPPTPPAPMADAATTPAVGGALPPPPPCTTDCANDDFGGGAGNGGAFAASLALVLALLARGAAAYTSAPNARQSRTRSSR